MTMRSYCLTTISRSADMGTMQETVVISADGTDEAVELAGTYLESVGTEALFSATLAEPSGKVVWWMQNGSMKPSESDGPPRRDGSA